MGNDRDVIQEVLGISNEPAAVQEESKTETTEVKTEETAEKVDETKEETTEETKEEPTETTEETKETTEETAEEVEEVTEEVAEVKPDDSLIALAKEINPDGEFADSTSAISAIKDDLKEKNEFIEKSRKWNDELIDLFENNPEVGEFTKAVIGGMDPKVAAGIYISETLAPEEGEEGVKTYQEELRKRKEAGEQRKVLEQEFTTNVGKSKDTVQEFIKENSIDPVEMEEVAKVFDEEMLNFKKGITTKSFLQLLWKGKTFDVRLKKAEEQAYLRGKNEKITMVKSKKNAGDGLPDLKSGLQAEKPKPKRDMFDEVLEYKRGGR